MDYRTMLKIASALAGIACGLAEVGLSCFKLKDAINESEEDEVNTEAEES